MEYMAKSYYKTIQGVRYDRALLEAAEEYTKVDGVNGLHREVTPLRTFDVPEVLEVQAVPFEDVRMVPEPPTVTNVLFP